MSKNKVSIIQSSSKVVSCNGSVAFSNHPNVYLNLGERSEVVCPYCGIKYIYVAAESNNSKASKQ